MPELPEVETIKNTLKLLAINKTIDAVEVLWPKIIQYPTDIEMFKHLLIGQTVKDIHRKGKFLLFELDEYILISHLRMEGKYSVDEATLDRKKHTHIIFHFTNGEELRYNDVRKFGTMHLYRKGEEQIKKPLIQLGPDPFEETFTIDYFYNKLKRTRRVIKNALLDQTILAGLGNIYVDETLFKAKIHPLTIASDLTKNEVKEIKRCATNTLKEAIKSGGTSIRSYVNSQGDMGMFQQELHVYGRENKACGSCGNMIIKCKVAGRGTHICPTCQKI